MHTGFTVEAETPVTGFISWYILWLYKYLDDASAMYKSSAAMAAQNSTENPDILDINLNFGLTDTTTYICDFHREQCWDRWLRKSENGLTASREEVLTLLRNVAKSSTKESLEKNLSSLKDSALWLANPKLRNWFEKTWLTESKVRMDIMQAAHS